MWEQVKHAVVEITREVCGSVRVEGKNKKSVWWNDEVKAAVRRKEVLAASNEEAKEDVWKLTEKKGERLKGVYIRAKRK